MLALIMKMMMMTTKAFSVLFKLNSHDLLPRNVEEVLKLTE